MDSMRLLLFLLFEILFVNDILAQVYCDVAAIMGANGHVKEIKVDSKNAEWERWGAEEYLFSFKFNEDGSYSFANISNIIRSPDGYLKYWVSDKSSHYYAYDLNYNCIYIREKNTFMNAITYEEKIEYNENNAPKKCVYNYANSSKHVINYSDYKYDNNGNWIYRKVIDGDDNKSHYERRIISYWSNSNSSKGATAYSFSNNNVYKWALFNLNTQNIKFEMAAKGNGANYHMVYTAPQSSNDKINHIYFIKDGSIGSVEVGAHPPLVQTLIYHNLGKDSFCSVITLESILGPDRRENGTTLRQIMLDDDSAQKIIDLVSGDTKWKNNTHIQIKEVFDAKIGKPKTTLY